MLWATESGFAASPGPKNDVTDLVQRGVGSALFTYSSLQFGVDNESHLGLRMAVWEQMRDWKLKAEGK